ncbi:MAG: hypothetical protein AB1480_07715 [Nitrospirota bacterium]
MVEDEKTIELKNKISELKQRLNQIYAQYFTDTSKSRVFETEFSLFLKACEHARNEISENLKLQYDVTKIGLSILIAASALTIYLFKLHVLFGMLILLGFGFFACGFMYLLLAAEIRIMRAAKFCAEMETYFQRHRWTTELKENLNLPDIPLWGEYVSKWDKDIFSEGHFEKKALYGPFRIIITLIEISALVYVIQSFIFQEPKLTSSVLIVCLILWVVAVIAQILLVHSIINKVDIKLQWVEKDRPEELIKKEINWKPHTWINILRLFLVLDIIFPEALKKGRDYTQ